MWNDRLKPIFETVVNILASVVLLKLIGVAGVFVGTIISTICAAALATLCSCTPQQVPIQIIFDTDLGNDVDDAIVTKEVKKLLDKYGIKPLVGVIPKCEDPLMDCYETDEKFWEKVLAFY